MKFNAAILLAGASAVSASFNHNIDAIGYSLGGLHSAVEAYTIPDKYAAQSINDAADDVNALIADAIHIAKGVESLAEDVAEDAVASLKTVLDKAEKLSVLVGKSAGVLLEDVEELGESAAHFVLGGFANIEHGALSFADVTARLFIGGLASEARALSNGVIGAFHDIVDVL
ncbi:uncharacterized protein K489DRAFT_367157 [Dissoconium aciculare CBS 342.82]|jgi:hypothetical protein|uniref:Hydrophobic surface binding protein A n=1 Tax=Dissoconium aciculare CBS 342.82 TaxID=1314786 RepID=A0A6J3MDB4_9PEZI|nr:uncharacterized protein K489DRAFT_367157 [Dissoconium aciculare CBS 342.82]KAF1825878.1 hypothetical protein K489DRAFT_367157 [Dissoconium aciculare CBS 342.82]